MSLRPCGFDSSNLHGPAWIPSVSRERPVKISSRGDLTASVTKLPAIAPLVLVLLTTSRKHRSQSCEGVGEPTCQELLLWRCHQVRRGRPGGCQCRRREAARICPQVCWP